MSLNQVSINAMSPPEVIRREIGQQPVSPSEMTACAENCIKNHVIAAMGIGLIPSMVVDVVGITAIEVNMIRAMAKIYDFPVPDKLVAAKILISLAGSIGPVYFSLKARSALKGVPLVGHAVFVGILSISGGASMYAVGKIFQKHYESDGTFLNSDNSAIRAYFTKKYHEGRQVVKEFLNDDSRTAASA